MGEVFWAVTGLLAELFGSKKRPNRPMPSLMGNQGGGNGVKIYIISSNV